MNLILNKGIKRNILKGDRIGDNDRKGYAGSQG